MLGGKSSAGKILKIVPLFISFVFVMVALITMPGTVGHKTKYVKKDDPKSELNTASLAVPIAMLSVTLFLLIVGIALNISTVKDKLGLSEEKP